MHAETHRGLPLSLPGPMDGPPIDWMPNELLIFMFGWLARWCSALASCRGTCRKWKDTVDMLEVLRPHRLDILSARSLLSIRPTVGIFGSMDHGWTVDRVWKFIESFVRDEHGCAGLRTLTVDDCMLYFRLKAPTADYVPSNILRLSCTCPNVVELRVRGCVFSSLRTCGLKPEHFRAVQSLHIDGSCHCNIHWSDFVLPNLQSLNLTGIRFLGNSFGVLATLPALKELHCFGLMTDHTSSAIMRLHPGLFEVDIFVDNACNFIAQAPALRVLTLQFMECESLVLYPHERRSTIVRYGELCVSAARRDLSSFVLGVSLPPEWRQGMTNKFPFLSYIDPRKYP